MPLIGTREHALSNRQLVPDYPTFRSDFLSEQAQPGTRRGNGKLVEQHPFSTLHAHFHYVNQFQIVVSGSGTIGRHAVWPVMVQYAGAYTPYGPLQADAGGLGYLVLRDAILPGLALMPEEVAKLDRSFRRRYFMAVAPESGDTAVLHAQEADGLAASMIRLSPGQPYLGRDPASGGGQFHVVVRGTAFCEGTEYASLCCIFSESAEPPLRLEAGAGGAEIVFVQFPASDDPRLI